MASKHQHSRISTRFIEELIRGMGHDIGAPARHIMHFAQMLSEQTADDIPLEDKHQRWLSMIHDSGKQIQNMLASLAKLSLLSMLSTESEQLDLRSIFHKQLADHQDHATKDSTQVSIDISGDWPKTLGCKEHWRTLFSCLLENAFKFQPDDPDHVIQIAARCECVNSELKLTLEDNGIGVRETQYGEISRPFKRLHAVDDYPGLGMGLAYCDFIAELNSATLAFDESPLGGLRATYHQTISQMAAS